MFNNNTKKIYEEFKNIINFIPKNVEYRYNFKTKCSEICKYNQILNNKKFTNPLIIKDKIQYYYLIKELDKIFPNNPSLIEKINVSFFNGSLSDIYKKNIILEVIYNFLKYCYEYILFSYKLIYTFLDEEPPSPFYEVLYKNKEFVNDIFNIALIYQSIFLSINKKFGNLIFSSTERKQILNDYISKNQNSEKPKEKEIYENIMLLLDIVKNFTNTLHSQPNYVPEKTTSNKITNMLTAIDKRELILESEKNKNIIEYLSPWLKSKEYSNYEKFKYISPDIFEFTNSINNNINLPITHNEINILNIYSNLPPEIYLNKSLKIISIQLITYIKYISEPTITIYNTLKQTQNIMSLFI